MKFIVKAILILIIILVVLYIAYTLYEELIGYLRVREYRKQGYKNVEFCPIWQTIFEERKQLKADDLYYIEKEEMVKLNAKEPFRIYGGTGGCQFVPNSPEAVAEFYKKELDYTVKINYFENLRFLGFFFENGKEVHKGRATFAKIFHYSNVISLLPQITSIIKKYTEALKERVREQKLKKLKIDLKEEFLLKLFEDLTGCILLTGAEKKIDATFEGMTVSEILKKMFKCYEMSARNLLNYFVPYAEELGLVKEAREFKRLQTAFRGIISEQYKSRYNSSSDQNLADNSILDILVKKNKISEKKTGKPEFSLEEISDYFEMFQFAGSDTSFQASSSYLTLLAQPENQIHQEKLYSELKRELKDTQIVDSQQLDSLKMLDMCFMETMRMANPAAEISEREVVKDFSICGCEIKEGDIIVNYLIQYQPAYFQNPYKFLPERWSREARREVPLMKQLPFSHGQRGCVGKYLGEMMVKLILVELVRRFRFEVEDGYKMKLGMNPLYGVANPDLILSLRDE